MLQIQGEDGTEHWLDLQKAKSLRVSAFLSRNWYNKLMSYPPRSEQDLPWARAQGSAALVCAWIRRFPTAAQLHEHRFISVWANSCQTPGQFKSLFKNRINRLLEWVTLHQQQQPWLQIVATVLYYLVQENTWISNSVLALKEKNQPKPAKKLIHTHTRTKNKSHSRWNIL